LNGRSPMKQIPVESFLTDVALINIGEREQRFRELRLIQTMQEIALILGAVLSLEQLEFALELTHTGVVAGGDLVGAERHGMVEESAELDFGVAQHIRVRRTTGLVFGKEGGEHALAVFLGEVDHFDVDADLVGDTHHVDQILARRAVFVVIVVFPVLHEKADHVPALLLQKQGGDRRIDTAGQADDDGLSVLCICVIH